MSAAHGSEAGKAARQAHKAEKRKEFSKAYLLYSEAAMLQPGKKSFRLKADALQSRAALASHPEPPAGSAIDSEPDVLVQPDEVFDSLTAKDLASVANPQPPPELHARPGRFNIDFHGDYKSLFTQVARLYGLENVFDSDFEAGPGIHFELQQADYREALHALEAATGSFVTPVSPSVFLVGKDTPQKRTDLEQNVTVSIPVPQATTQQEMIELAQGVRQALDIQKLGWDSKTNTLVIRDRVSRALPAQALFQNLLSYRPQIMVELQLIEIRKSDIVNYGINLPNMIQVAFTNRVSAATGATGTLPANTNNPFPFGSRSYTFIAQAAQGGSSLLRNAYRGLFPNSLSLFSLSVSEAQALADFSDSRSRTMLRTDLRATDGQPSTFHIGDRYPILTSSYSAGISVSARFAPVPSFTYEDLGISLKVTPHVHGTEEISIEVESEFKILTGQTLNGNPLIFNRKLTSQVRLRDDEWGVVGGLVSRSDSKQTNGTPGLSQIPLLGHLFRKYTRQKDESQILIVMKPRLVSLPGPENAMKAVRVGTETRPYIPL
ncbi:MAG: type II and III secretion system protein [Acidobacteriota bacterium]|nr:type II and III secretion system protein [Acidobacteriota bacterium]